MERALEAKSLTRMLSIRGEISLPLREVGLRIEPGQIVGLTGPSGSGKSTFVRLLMGLDRRSGGAVHLDGAEVSEGGWAEFRRQVAWVMQEPPGTEASAEALVGEFGGALDEFRAALNLLGLNKELATRPMAEVSGGEKRRLHIALAASRAPRFYVLDEPSAGLDPESAKLLASWMIKERQRGRGLLLVSHDELLLARTSKRLVVLYDGEVAAEGDPAEILAEATAEAAKDPIEL